MQISRGYFISSRKVIDNVYVYLSGKHSQYDSEICPEVKLLDEKPYDIDFNVGDYVWIKYKSVTAQICWIGRQTEEQTYYAAVSLVRILCTSTIFSTLTEYYHIKPDLGVHIILTAWTLQKFNIAYRATLNTNSVLYIIHVYL